jgi:non-specific serine/threonine protein kinase
MEWVRGESLGTRLQGGPLPAAEIVRIGAAVARGLAALHGLRASGLTTGIVHRDLKPGNVLLGDDGRVKITDFGLARAFHAAGDAPSSAMRGTPAYMAPEQARSEPLDGRTDLWALGAILWEMATGERLLRGGSLFEVIVSLVDLDERVGDAAAIDRAVPGLGAIVRACLRSSMAERPARASTVAAALEGLITPPGSGASPMGPTSPSVPSPLPDPDAETLFVPGPHGSSALRVVRLPSRPDAFVGRMTELQALQPPLLSRPLVNLVGAGGVGKTRLALALAARVEGQFRACWFVDASGARDQAELARVTHAALGLEGGADATGAIVAALTTRGRSLLVLDNLEQCDGAGTLVVTLLSALPGLAILATSRAPLALTAEAVFPLLPLGSEDAASLFAARSGRGAGDPAVLDLVRRLDGLPLAIELAAARARAMPPETISARLSDRFRLLTGGHKDLPPRQRTLQGTLDWSWDLLRPWERHALVRLAWFRGPFTLDAAESVLDLSPWQEAPWPPDVVTALVDQSLVRLDGAFLSTLATVAEYGRQRADEGEREKAGQAHAAWFLSLARAADPWDPAARPTLLRATLDLEVATVQFDAGGRTEDAGFVLLLLHCVQRDRAAALPLTDLLLGIVERLGETGLAADLLGSHAVALQMASRLDEALQVLERARQIAERATAEGVRSRLALFRAEVELRLGRVAEAERSLDQARALPDYRFLASGRLDDVEASLRWFQGRTEDSLAAAQRAVAAAKRSGRPLSVPNGLLLSGVALVQLGRVDEARQRYEEVLRAATRWGMPALEAVVRNNLAVLDHQAQRLDEAEEGYETAREQARALGERRLLAVATGNIGIVEHDRAGFDAAQDRYEDAALILEDVGDRRFAGWFRALRAAALWDLGRVAEAEREARRGREHVEATGDPLLLRAIQLCEAHREVAAGRLRAAEEAVQAVRKEAGGPERPVLSDNLRFALRLLEKAVERARHGGEGRL